MLNIFFILWNDYLNTFSLMISIFKRLLFLSFLIISANVVGQSFSYPEIPKEAKTLQDFIPSDWKVIDSAKGDLNHNNLIEYALIMQYKDSITIVHEEEGQLKKFKTRPNILVIIFQYVDSDKFVLIEQNNHFTTQQMENNFSFPFTSMKINDGVFTIDFTIFYGPAAHRMISYIFRCQSKKFVLIGADSDYFNVATREYEKESFNFLPGKWSSETGNGDSGTGKITWHTLPSKKLRPLSAFREPEVWRVTTHLNL